MCGGGGQKPADYRPLAEANKYAARLQYKASQDSIAEWRRQYGIQQENWRPWRETGRQALDAMRTGLGLGPDGQLLGKDEYGAFEAEFKAPTLTDDPGYAFRQAEGEKGLRRHLAAAGMRSGGATAKALARYNQDLASQEYAMAYDRARSEYQMRQGQLSARFGQLAQLAGYGYGGTQAMTNVGMQTTGNVTGAMQAGAGALGAGQVGAANAMVRQQQEENAYRAAKRGSMFSTVLTAGGAVIGGMYGGPQGAMLGASLGGAVGGAMGGNSNLSGAAGIGMAAAQYLPGTWGGGKSGGVNQFGYPTGKWGGRSNPHQAPYT